MGWWVFVGPITQMLHEVIDRLRGQLHGGHQGRAILRAGFQQGFGKQLQALQGLPQIMLSGGIPTVPGLTDTDTALQRHALLNHLQAGRPSHQTGHDCTLHKLHAQSSEQGPFKHAVQPIDHH